MSQQIDDQKKAISENLQRNILKNFPEDALNKISNEIEQKIAIKALKNPTTIDLNTKFINFSERITNEIMKLSSKINKTNNSNEDTNWETMDPIKPQEKKVKNFKIDSNSSEKSQKNSANKLFRESKKQKTNLPGISKGKYTQTCFINAAIQMVSQISGT